MLYPCRYLSSPAVLIVALAVRPFSSPVTYSSVPGSGISMTVEPFRL
ncbi:MAG: hypothetical protein BWY81_00059 [Firmicutes bacterium ADurb.Bin467]|nr:MAG: hypothetical protein BWY81_00059 [Firmicutes bacterium ADurb.Bin467]